MHRGTTPTIFFDLPFDASLLSLLYITFAQNGTTVFEKTILDVTREVNTITCPLSQEDTLLLESDSMVDVQLRCKFPDGKAVASNIIRISVNQILKDGVI